MKENGWKTLDSGEHVYFYNGEVIIPESSTNDVKFNFKGNNEKFHNVVKETINNLMSEYNSPLKQVNTISFNEVMKQGNLGNTTNYGTTINLGHGNVETIYHEFAHTLADEQRANLLNENKEFWNEIKKIEKNYYKEENNLLKKTISSFKEYDPNFNLLEAKNKISLGDNEYYKTNTDEFMAEGFANYKLGKTKSPYAKQITETIDKFFKK